MKQATKKTIAAFAAVAITDPTEREKVLAALEEKPHAERRDKMLNGREACELAGVARRTLREWELRGFIHPRHITRRRVRFSRNELEAFLCESGEG